MLRLERPSFLAGTIAPKQTRKPIIPVNKRKGFGNYDIERNGMTAPDIKPRFYASFDEMRATNAGDSLTVSLSDKTLSELITVQIPDPQDVQWLTEKARLVAIYKARGMSDAGIKLELSKNKPLGREQRTIKSVRNIAQSQLTTEQQLNELKQEIKDGRVESQRAQANIIAQFAVLMADVKTISSLTQTQLADLGASFARLGVPVNHKQLGLEPRFVDNDYYIKNAGLINLLLFSKVREEPNDQKNYNYDLLVKNYANNTKTGLPAVKLTTMIRGLRNKGQQRRFLDLDKGGLISLAQINAIYPTFQGGLQNPVFAITP
jgi:hypothetical protein